MATTHIVPTAPKDGRLEFKRLGFCLEFILSADGLACIATYTPSGNGAPMTHTELQGFLAQAKVKEGTIDHEIASLLNAATQGKPFENCIIARGIPMVPGDNGIIQLAVADALEIVSTADENTGRIDLRNVQSFLNVSSGQLIGTILSPGEGVSGTTVSGRSIPAQPGLPLELELVKNIRLGDDGVSLYADADGCLYRHGKELSVEEIYTIKGDVDFKIGNIMYNGYIDIKGDVLDGFTVQASKGIKIQGNIGTCNISSDGDVSFCGMNGQGKGSISCGGQVRANFIHDTQVDAEGDVLVETEIRNSSVHSNGCIKINKGILTGGEYIALGGIESNIIGTITSQRTRLVVGICHRDLLELNQLFNQLKELVARFNASGRSMDAKEFGQIRADITAMIQNVRERQYPSRNPKLNIKKRLHEGVTITLGQISEDVREGRDGPFSMIENTLEGGFRYLGLTDLSVKADDIEESFRQQQRLMKSGNTGTEV
jgi:uncharacterized protein (DUF342 family)